jgi:ATP-dependent DNA ligase
VASETGGENTISHKRQKAIKVKLTQQQEFVIGGYTLPEGRRK